MNYPTLEEVEKASKALKKAAEERMAMMGISTLTGYINALIGRDISKRK